ncbi:MAG: DUF1343 domain-containing protein [Spirochaetes bacterium]|nr:MAG: DUF1343 domain-containing protein [Spirochaetota bacterium]
MMTISPFKHTPVRPHTGIFVGIALAVVLIFGTLLMSGFSEEEPAGPVLPGIDVLAERGFDSIAGKRVGLVTNHTGITRSGASTIDTIHGSGKCTLVALFSPEHGIRGTADESVASSVDKKTGLPIYSLYGQSYKPSKAMLRGIEVLVFDIQDIGTRFYTYIGTMALCMRAAAETGIKFVVLDRPNPIGGVKVEGAVPENGVWGGITSIYPIPTRHGMTAGELALLFNGHFKIGCTLEVVPVKNWKRSMYFDQTGLTWLNPSPNMKTLNGAILYPGLGVTETTNASVARGTDKPFEMYGAPFFDGKRIADNLSKRSTPGIQFKPCTFTPTAPYHPYRYQLCSGVQAEITDRETLDSIAAGLHMLQAMYEIHPDRFMAYEGFVNETGDRYTWNLLAWQKLAPEKIIAAWQPRLESFKRVREKYLLYK